jgi:hypothetical protein
LPRPCVTGRTPDPSGFIAKISQSPARLLTNAIDVPSGDQAGELSEAGLFVSLVTADEARSST